MVWTIPGAGSEDVMFAGLSYDLSAGSPVKAFQVSNEVQSLAVRALTGTQTLIAVADTTGKITVAVAEAGGLVRAPSTFSEANPEKLTSVSFGELSPSKTPVLFYAKVTARSIGWRTINTSGIPAGTETDTLVPAVGVTYSAPSGARDAFLFLETATGNPRAKIARLDTSGAIPATGTPVLALSPSTTAVSAPGLASLWTGTENNYLAAWIDLFPPTPLTSLAVSAATLRWQSGTSSWGPLATATWFSGQPGRTVQSFRVESDGRLFAVVLEAADASYSYARLKDTCPIH